MKILHIFEIESIYALLYSLVVKKFIMNEPIVILKQNFQEAWQEAVRELSNRNWEIWDLIVQIKDPISFNTDFHYRVTDFAKQEKLKPPKDVAYTIFPHRQFDNITSYNDLFLNYKTRFYPRIMKKRISDWGTYFYRMINYHTTSGDVNQLQNIIESLNNRSTQTRTSYQILIQYPGNETIRYMGGPCLNYITLQIETGNPKVINLLALYRNHEFLERAYGNYWGLSNLLKFLADVTDSQVGVLTCISSHAYVGKCKRSLSNFINL